MVKVDKARESVYRCKRVDDCRIERVDEHARAGRDNAGRRARFEATMDAEDAELARGGGPYFLGAELSLVECVFAPMLERIAASIPYYKGLAVRGTGCAPAPRLAPDAGVAWDPWCSRG